MNSHPVPKDLKFDVFGIDVLVRRSDDGWSVYYIGSEGKRRPAGDIVIPADVAESDVQGFLADLRHEWASEQYPNVTRKD